MSDSIHWWCEDEFYELQKNIKKLIKKKKVFKILSSSLLLFEFLFLYQRSQLFYPKTSVDYSKEDFLFYDVW